MNTVKLSTAVLIAINSLDSFSAYDVTQEIRRMSNDGEIEISDVMPQIMYRGVWVSDIQHNEVRELVNEYYQNDIFDATTSTDFGYVLYTKNTIGDAVASHTHQQAPTTAASLNTSPAQHQTILNKIKEYLKTTSFDRVTIKQMQSMLKGYSITCEEIQDMMVDGGYMDESDKSDTPSKVTFERV